MATTVLSSASRIVTVRLPVGTRRTLEISNETSCEVLSGRHGHFLLLLRAAPVETEAYPVSVLIVIKGHLDFVGL